MDFHKTALKKVHDERHLEDNYLLCDKYPDYWAILMDKGYQGCGDILRCYTPTKKTVGKMLSYEDQVQNKKIASDRIIVENFFGRMSTLWGVVSIKYRWDENFYDKFFRMALSLTNYHVRNQPLRAVDGDIFRRLRTRIYSIRSTTVQKRKRSQQKYRVRRNLRISAELSHDDENLDI